MNPSEIEALIAKLHPLERKVLPTLKNHSELHEIVKASNMQEIEVMRALQWLENKDLLKLNTENKRVVLLDKNGLKYQKEGLPEIKLLQALTTEFQSLNKLAQKIKLDSEELNACIGILKRKVAIDISKTPTELLVKLGPQGQKILKDGTFEEKFLAKKYPLELEQIQDLDRFAFDELKKRKEFLKIEDLKKVTINLTEDGHQILQNNFSAQLNIEVVNRLTKEMLKMGSWKNKQFRSYDVEINVPKIFGGKKHFVNEATEYAKSIWIEMGFKEMTGNYTSTSFWNFDALFVPQDHPAREMQDTYFLGEPVEKGRLPNNKDLIKRVKDVHENGGNTKSKGWGYKWSEEESKINILRTHTTVLTAHTLANLKNQDLPAKFFAIGKCFRNEALDWKHLNEFNQTEGIVIDEKANFRNLLGYLKEFFKKMGFPEARFRPAYFPYTEPSVEIDVFHPVKKEWVELGGAGMLRPEVVMPLLGKDIPVLAWGPGFDRIIMDYYKLSNIRDLYKNDLKQLREIKAWIK